jgi:hypothetical protein
MHLDVRDVRSQRQAIRHNLIRQRRRAQKEHPKRATARDEVGLSGDDVTGQGHRCVSLPESCPASRRAFRVSFSGTNWRSPVAVMAVAGPRLVSAAPNSRVGRGHARVSRVCTACIRAANPPANSGSRPQTAPPMARYGRRTPLALPRWSRSGERLVRARRGEICSSWRADTALGPGMQLMAASGRKGNQWRSVRNARLQSCSRAKHQGC